MIMGGVADGELVGATVPALLHKNHIIVVN